MKKIRFKTKNIMMLLLMIIFFILILFSSYRIIKYIIDNKNNREIKDKLNNNIKAKKEEITEDKYSIDFKNLKETNSDTIAYLKVNKTNIDYIVVKGKDNSYYLKHNFNKEWNNSGWIFNRYSSFKYSV